MVFMILLSIFAYQNIPKEIFPPSALDKITVQGGYAGSSADVLDKMVVKTIEDDLKNISEIESLETVIQNGSFIIKANIKELATMYIEKEFKVPKYYAKNRAKIEDIWKKTEEKQ